MAVNESLQRKAHEMLEQMGLDKSVSPERRSVGRGSAVTPDEADAIRWMYVAEGKNISAISRDTGRTRETIGAIVKDAETDELRKYVRDVKRTRAKQILAGATDTASELWVESMKAAAEKGNHKPMQDLLLHEEVIKPHGNDGGAGLVVMIGGAPEDVRIAVISRPDGTPIYQDGHERIIDARPGDAEIVAAKSQVRTLPAPAPPSNPIFGAQVQVKMPGYEQARQIAATLPLIDARPSIPAEPPSPQCPNGAPDAYSALENKL